jgi:uncharacterized membrane protein YidH (DUF202 family)
MAEPGATSLFDPGLQPERTDLAWRRTALGFFANAALVARFAVHAGPDPIGYVVAGVLALTGVLMLVRSGRLYARRNARLAAGLPAARAGALRAVWAATTACTFAAVALVVLS